MPTKKLIVTVSQVNRKIALLLSSDSVLNNINVRGEISNFKLVASGHMYFTLKDENTSLKVVMFRSFADGVGFLPENGNRVIVSGSLKCYEKDGVYQLYASEMVNDGDGEILSAFNVLKNKLEAEGLFKQKRNLPAMPKKICVITSETGAVLHDVHSVLERRCPFVELILIPALVQGESAPDSIISAIKRANEETDADIIIFGRGGGSSEDLSAFNDEAVARAIFASRIPTISAVGHETDFSIADFVADMRAPTPSAGAELAVPDMGEVLAGMETVKQAVHEKLKRQIDIKESNLRVLTSDIKLKNPVSRFEANERRIDHEHEIIKSAIRSLIEIKYNSLMHQSEKIEIRIRNIMDAKQNLLIRSAEHLEALNPLKVLMRGYSITYKDDLAITDSESVEMGDKIKIKLNSGVINAVVESVGKE